MLYIPRSMKCCAKCDTWHPATAKYFRKERYGLADCLKCYNAHARQLEKYRNSRKLSPKSGILYIPQSLKCCTKCGEWKLASVPSFKIHKKGRALLTGWCRECYKARWREWAKGKEQELSAKGKAYHNAHREHHLEKSKEWKRRNKERVLNYTREYHNKPEVKKRYSALQKKYRNKEGAKERQARRYKEYRTANKDKIAAQNRLKRADPRYKEQHRQRNAKYRKSSKGKLGKQRDLIVYRTRKRALPATFTKEQWKRSLDYFNHKCAVCGRDLTGLFHTAAADHWIPLTSPDCPGTIPTNIVPLCQDRKGGEGGCNNSKGNKDPSVWLISKFGKRKAAEVMKRIETYFEWATEQDDPEERA